MSLMQNNARCFKDARLAYVAMLRFIRSARASIFSLDLCAEAIEGRVVAAKFRIQDLMDVNRKKLAAWPEYSAEHISQFVEKLEHQAYRRLCPMYVEQAEKRFLGLINDFHEIQRAERRYDDTDGTFAAAVKEFRAGVRCYMVARGHGVVFENDAELRRRMQILREQVLAFLVPTVDAKLALGGMSRSELEVALSCRKHPVLVEGHLPKITNWP